MDIDPADIVAERDRVLDRMVRYFLDRSGTKALFLSGSLAAGTADAWSDIDFRAVVTPEVYEGFLAGRESAPSAWGDLLFNQVRPGTSHSVSHFRPFLKVDTFYYRPDQLIPSPWYTLPTKVLFDPEGLVKRVIEESRGMAFVPAADTVERSIGFGLAAAHEVLRRARRGELCYAKQILDELRLAVVDADDYLNGRPWYGLSHFESRADPRLVAVVQTSHGPLEREAILRNLGSLAERYREQILGLHRRFPLSRDLEADLAAVGVVHALLRPDPPQPE